MTQIFTGSGLGLHGSSIGQLGNYGPKGSAGLGQGGESVYVNVANGNVVLQQADGFLADFGVGLDLVHSYNSRDFGKWQFNTETSLSYEGMLNTVGSVVKRRDEDGHLSCFSYDEHQKAYRADDGGIATLTFDGLHWSYREGNGLAITHYNRDGQLTSMCDRDGHSLIFSYQEGHLANIVNACDRQKVTWSFNQGLLSDVTFQSDDQTIHHLHYDYDTQARLRRVSRDLGDGTTYWIAYEYAGESTLISDIREADGVSLHLDYDSIGRIKHTVDGEGRETFYAYDEGCTQITNGLGEQWTYYYDTQSRLMGIDGPESFRARYHYNGQYLDVVTQGQQRWQFVYNDTGDCVRIENPDGQMILYEYDHEHRILSETRYQQFDEQHHPIQPQTSHYIYDEQGHLRFEVNADGVVTEHRYNLNGCRSNSRCYLQGQWLQTDTTFTTLVDWAASQPQALVSLIDYQYDWRGQLCQEIHYAAVNAIGEGIITADAIMTYCRYDAAGRCVEKANLTENGFSTTYYRYDDLGRLIQLLDNQQHLQTIQYDDAHQRRIKIEPNGLQTVSIYDNSGLLLSLQRLDAQHNYGTVTYHYDVAGRLVAETDVEGKTRYLFYFHDGRLQGSISTSGQVTEYSYDEDGHCISTHLYHQTVHLQGREPETLTWALIKPESSCFDRINQVVYNEYQQIAFQIDAQGAVIAYRYDAEGRVIAKIAFARRLQREDPARLLTLNDMILIHDPDDRLITYYYDACGRLQAEINGEGAATGYRYDAQGNLIEQIRYANKQSSTRTGDWFTDAPVASKFSDLHTYSLYHAAGLKVADIDAEGYLTEYVYDARGLNTETIAYYTKIGAVDREKLSLDAIRPHRHINDHFTYYRYNDLNQLVEEKTYRGLVITYTYDEQGHLLSKTSTDSKTHVSRQQCSRYDALGRVVQSLDEMGSAKLLQAGPLTQEAIDAIWQQYSTRYTYDIAGRLQTKTNALQQTSRYFYNEDGLLTYSVNADGAISETRYNAFQQVETTIRYSAYCSLDPSALTTQILRQYTASCGDAYSDEVTHYEYNQLGQLYRKQQGNGSLLVTTYNAFGELEQTAEHISVQQTVYTAYQYDRRGLLSSRIADWGGIQQSYKVQYDVFGRVNKEWDGRDGVTTYLLNKRGEQIRTDHHGQGITTVTYDAFSRVLSSRGKVNESDVYDDTQQTLTVSHMGKTSTIVTQFNAFGDKIAVTDGNQQTTYYQYDVKGNVERLNAPENSSTTYRYDAAGHLILQEDATGLSVRYTYDAEGRVLIKTVDPDGLNLKTNYTYDALGRQLRVVEAGHCTQFTYDNRGNLIQTQIDPDGLNLTTSYVYDARNLAIRETRHHPRGVDQITTYEWDNLGRCIATTIDPDGLALTTTYAYDNNDNLICQTTPNQQSTQFIYNRNNRLRYRIDARGVVTEHRYDPNDHEIIQTITYAHRIKVRSYIDEASVQRMIQPDDSADHHQFFVFDEGRHLTFYYDGLGYATQYAYDANDNCVMQIRYATPCSLSQLINGNRPLPSASTDSRVTYFAYDGLNRQRYKIDSKGNVSEMRYDAAGRIIAQTRYAHSLSLGTLDYTEQNIQSHLKVEATQDETIQYAYDIAGRLTRQVSAGGRVVGYQYDAFGNKIECCQYATLLTLSQLTEVNWVQSIQKSEDDRVSRSVFDAANREIYRISPLGRCIERRYDASGNVFQEIIHANRFDGSVMADSGQDKVTDFHYDAAGRLVEKCQGALATRYAYDGNHNVISKTEANHAIWTYRYDEANQLIETLSPSVALKTLQQGQWVDETKTIMTRNEYDSFGNLIKVIKDVGGMNQTIQYTYDANNRNLQTIYPDVWVNHAGSTISNERQEIAQRLTESSFYNAYGEVIETRDRGGFSRYFVYDNTGLLTYSIDPQGGLIHYQYNAFETLTQKTTFAERLSLKTLVDYTVDTIKRASRYSETDRHEQYAYDKDHQLIETQKDRVNAYCPTSTEYFYLRPTTRQTYNAFGEIVVNAVQINQTDWALTRNTFDQDGLKSATLDAEHYLTTYRYNEFGLLAEEIQYADRVYNGHVEPSAKDRCVTFLYDALGQMMSKTLKQVTIQQLTGNGSNYENITRDLTTRYEYDALGHLVALTDAEGHTAYSYYNSVGQLTAKVGPLMKAGRSATTYYYDALGRLIECRQWAKGAIEANSTYYVLDSESNVDQITYTAYDQLGQVIQQTDGVGHQVNYSYDANGNRVRSWQTLLQANHTRLTQDKRYTYDANNHLIETATIKSGGGRATENMQYNAFGELVKKGIGGIYSTQIDYDLCGRVWRSNTQGFFQIHVYDLADHVTQIVTSTNAFCAEYDENGVDLSKRIFETASSYDKDAWAYDLQRQDTVYNALGQMIEQIKPGRVTSDARQRQIAHSKVRVRQQVDRWGNVLLHTDARGYTTRYDYNAMDNLIEQVLPEVSVVDEHGVARLLHPVIHYAYDALGRAIAMTDANQHTVAKVFDAAGHIIQEIDALGFHRDKAYNLLEQLMSSQNERGVITAYTYDQANRLLSISTPKTSQQYAYDGAGQLIRQIDGQRNESQYFYNELGQQIGKEQRSHNGKTNYEYDDAGHKTLERDANGHVMTWRYDANGRLLSHTDLGGHQTDYTYNLNGLLLTEKSTSGKSISMHYYSDGEIQQFVDNSRLEVVDYTYDVDGNMLSKDSSRVGDWVLETDDYQYDALGRLQQVKRHSPQGSPAPDHELFSIDYQYDAVGNIRAIKVDANDSGYQHTVHQDYFRYDANNRMVMNKGQLQNGTIGISNLQGTELAYDACGNIKTAIKYEGGNRQVYAYQYAMDNQLERIQKNGHDLQAKLYEAGLMREEMLYDENGCATQHNLLQYEAGYVISQVTQDAHGHEINRTQYRYDDVGNLTKMTTVIAANGKTPALIQEHQYGYELWDSYQQKIESVSVEASGYVTSYGMSERIYDINGQIQEALDTPVGVGTMPYSTYYFSSYVDGVRARKDKEGQTSYLTVAGKTIGDLQLDHQNGQHLELYGGFTPVGNAQKAAPGKGFSMSSPFGAITLQDFHNVEFQSSDVVAELPESPQNNLGAYTLQSGDTLESIALMLYGDSSLWYLIADANGITDRYAHAGEKGSQLHIGQRLNIPQSAKSQHHTNQTHNIMSSDNYLGDLTPTVPSLKALNSAIAPHKKQAHFWKTIAKVVSVVASAVGMVLSAGAFAAIAVNSGLSGFGLGALSELMAHGLSVLGGVSQLTLPQTMGVSLAAGFIGSIAGQTAANLLNGQKGIDFKDAFISGLATAATAGTGTMLNTSSTYSSIRKAMDNASLDVFSITNAAEMMERDALSQSMNLAFYDHQHFDWLELGTSTATAGIMGSKPLQHLNDALQENIGPQSSFLTSELQSLATHAATTAATGNHFDATQILTDNLGQALTSSLMQTAVSEVSDNGYHEKEEVTTTSTYNSSLSDETHIFLSLGSSSTAIEQLSNAWNHIEEELLNYGSQLFDEWRVRSTNPPANMDKLGSMLGVAGEVVYGVEGMGGVGYGVIKDLGIESQQSDITDSFGQYDIDYSKLIVKNKGKSYRKEQIVANSNYYKTPGSPIWGDASREIQIEAIDALITSSIKHGLNAHETAYVLAIARYESGFNPYAAAGTTSASGLGQFVKGTGIEYGINDQNQWHINIQARALVKFFLYNQNISIQRKLPDSYIYKFHHDGPSGNYGGLQLSNKFIIPKIRGIKNVIDALF